MTKTLFRTFAVGAVAGAVALLPGVASAAPSSDAAVTTAASVAAPAATCWWAWLPVPCPAKVR